MTKKKKKITNIFFYLSDKTIVFIHIFFFSLQMVLMWTCGDVFKTTYFYVRKTPPQFVICGLLQVMVDIAILTQVWLYYENTTKKKKSQHMHF